jgi:hypothetical protein
MKVFKYIEFLLEGNTPEDFINISLDKIKRRLEEAFDQTDDVRKLNDFTKYNLQLIEIEKPSNFNFSRRNLTIKFLDGEQNRYKLLISMNVEDAAKNKGQGDSGDFKVSDIKKCSISFTKYSLKDNEELEVDSLPSSSINPDSIDADFLIKLKIDLDEGKDPTEEEEFKIETEDETSMEVEQPGLENETPSQASINNSSQVQNQAPVGENTGDQ